MRKLASFHFMSLDGVVGSPDQFVHEDLFEDIVSAISIAIADQDAVLLGRAQYDEWSAYWPSSSIEPFASFINSVRKHVVSTSLDRVDWNNAALLGGALPDAVARLKEQSGGTLCVQGSIALTQSLLSLDLIDELRLVVFPVLAGSGRRLLERECQPMHLRLEHAQQTPKGINYLVYRTRG